MVANRSQSSYIVEMTSKPAKPQTPEQIARLERQRVARIEGEKALAQVDKEYVDVRKNMERLRALRLAKEAEDALNPPLVVAKKKKAAPKKKLAEVAERAPETVGEE